MSHINFDLDRIVQPDRVHSDAYVSKPIFEREMDRIFERHWVFIGHEGELPNAGDFRQRKIGRQPVIFTRDDQGKTHVLMNRCSHRANAVCPLEKGNARAFTCSYHGWRFKLNGDLVGVPYADRYPESFDRAKLGLTPAAQVASHRGFVFATLNPDEVSLEEWLGPLTLQELDDIADLSPLGELAITAGAHRLRYAGNWKLQVENAIDGYHTNFAHRSKIEAVKWRTGFDPMPLSSSSAPTRVRHLGNGHCTWDSREINKGMGNANYPPGTYDGYYDSLVTALGVERADQVLAKNGSHLYIFPNFSYVAAHYRIFQPISADETEVQLFPIMLKGVAPAINSQRLRIHENFYGPAGGGQTDDLEVFERNQIGLNATYQPWSLLARGTNLEQLDNDGAVSSQITDELTNRVIFQRWRELMGEEEMA